MKHNASSADTSREQSSFIKNLSIYKKLVLGFGLMLVILLTVSILSALNAKNIGFQAERYYRYTVPNTNSTWTMRSNLISTQRYLLQAILVSDSKEIQDNLTLAQTESENVTSALDAFAGNQSSNARANDIAQLRDLLAKAKSSQDEIGNLLASSSKDSSKKAHDIYNTQYRPIVEQAESIFSSFSDIQRNFAEAQKLEAQSLMSRSWVILIISSLISVLLTFLIARIICKSILTPVNEIDHVYKEIAKGNLSTKINYESNDEMGILAENIRKTNALINSYIHDMIQKLNYIANGDLCFTMDLDYIGDFGAIKTAFVKTTSTLSHTLSMIESAAGQVNTGTDQVSSGAQALAAGSTEQASSVEELSASITTISAQAAENSENAKKAAQYVEQTSQNVENGGNHMQQLTVAMDNIGSASDQITNITKVIEDIAFQTNILSLNAAIEAARAGTAGKGFSVVADEVRNLAAKSAEAAKKTADLIQHSVNAVHDGTQITRKTAEILKEISQTTDIIHDIVDKINFSTSDQASSIDQIRLGLEQVSAVVQTNAATAEENSAASEEMSAQANMLRDEVGKFRLNTESGEKLYQSIPESPSYSDEAEDTFFSTKY